MIESYEFFKTLLFFICIPVFIIMLLNLGNNVQSLSTMHIFNRVNSQEEEKKLGKDTFFIMLRMFAICSLFFMLLAAVKYCDSEIENNVKAEYVGFYDGQVVDLNNIDLSSYNMSCDHEEKKVYLTDKTEYTFIPIPIRFY